MPELPEVEVLVRHLAPLIHDRRIRRVEVRRAKVLRSTSPREFNRHLRGARFTGLSRRGKYLLFTLRPARGRGAIQLLGHLGMTGRMYLSAAGSPLPKHAAVVFNLGEENFIFEDTRYFGRMTLDTGILAVLGPEPLEEEFTLEWFAAALRRSAQPIKVKLLDQSFVAGIGNIYASEALFRAGISPRTPARRLNRGQIKRLRCAIRETLTEAIASGSTVAVHHFGSGKSEGVFYYGSETGVPEGYEGRLRVYDRAGQPCLRCGGGIRRLAQGGRSTFYCPRCQRGWGASHFLAA